jgi:hypothetical protein
MKRGLSIVLAGLLLAACGSDPPPPRTFTHTVAYGVVVGALTGGVDYTVSYTGPDGSTVEARPAGGKPWGTKFDITLTEHRGDFQGVLAVNLVEISPPWPQIQCRIDVDGELAASGDEVGFRCSAMAIVKPGQRPKATPSAAPA